MSASATFATANEVLGPYLDALRETAARVFHDIPARKFDVDLDHEDCESAKARAPGVRSGG